MRAVQLCDMILRLDMGCEVEVIIQPGVEADISAGRWKVERVVPEIKDPRAAEPEVTKLVLVCRERATEDPTGANQERRLPAPPEPQTEQRKSRGTLCRYIRGLFG